MRHVNDPICPSEEEKQKYWHHYCAARTASTLSERPVKLLGTTLAQFEQQPGLLPSPDMLPGKHTHVEAATSYQAITHLIHDCLDMYTDTKRLTRHTCLLLGWAKTRQGTRTNRVAVYRGTSQSRRRDHARHRRSGLFGPINTGCRPWKPEALKPRSGG